MEQRILSNLDNGPKSSNILTLSKRFYDSRYGINRAPFFYLGFGIEDLAAKQRAAELYELISYYKEHCSKNEDMRSKLELRALSEWIYSTNKIEFAGMDSVEETELVITGNIIGDCLNIKETTQTYELVKSTSSRSAKLVARQIRTDLLHEWHRSLFQGVIDGAGTFRKIGVEAKPTIVHGEARLDAHLFPHHSIIKEALNTLTVIVTTISGEIDKIEYEQRPIDKILALFALAAFTQFHFVDIHPYVDGNGRMCRFLSKYLLDSMLPLNIPMFKDRATYLQTITSARHQPIQKMPTALMMLLLDSAIAYYKQITDLEKTYNVFIYATSLDELKTIVEECVPTMDEADRAFLHSKFDSLDIGITRVVCENNVVYHLKKDSFSADLDAI